MTRIHLARTVATLCILLGSSFPCACQRATKSTLKSAPQASTRIHWVSYNDSAEGAFTMDVPLGWQIQGGMYRFGYFDARWRMGVRSLDGKVVILINDVDVPPYALPSPYLPPEGQPYQKPQQFQMVVERFQRGQDYAATYAKHRFGSACKTLIPTTSAWTPTLPASWSAESAQSSDASLSYNCTTTDGPRIATVFTRNALIQGQGYAFWIATPISVLCAPGRCKQAYAITQHMIDSWQKNPQWVEYQNRLTQIGLQHIREGFQQFMQQMQQFHEQFTRSLNQQVSGYYAHQHAEQQQFSSWDDIINNQTNVTDPATGAHFQVFSGPHHNYYRNGLGVTINSDISPGPDYTQMNVDR